MKKEADGYIPLKVRLLAWWEGVDSQVALRRSTPQSSSPKDKVIEVDEEARGRSEYFDWSDVRTELNNRIWGEGFMGPGGAEYTMDLIKPAGFDPSFSVLDIGAGLGGGVRAIAQAFGMWVEGMETNPKLAKKATEAAFRDGLENRASVSPYDPGSFTLKFQRYHCVFARESFFAIEDKERLLDEMYAGLKETGQLIFTDYMIAEKLTGDSEHIKEWIKGEPTLTFPWRIPQYRAALRKLDFDIRIFADDTENFRQMILYRLKEFVEDLKSEDLTRDLVTALVHEAEVWKGRVKAMERGALKLIRVHAIKKQKF